MHFSQAHNNLETKCSEFRLDSKLSGTTVTIIVYLREQNRLVVAHVGNSRAVLCKLSKYGRQAQRLEVTLDSGCTLPFRIVVGAGLVGCGEDAPFGVACIWRLRTGCGVRAIDLTVDHIPTNIRELRRIIKAGNSTNFSHCTTVPPRRAVLLAFCTLCGV